MTVVLDRRAWAAQVASALAGLPVHQSHALRLLYFDHASEREVAREMGVALEHARQAAADGLRNLGHALRAAPPAIS